MDRLRHQKLSELLQATRLIGTAVKFRTTCQPLVSFGADADNESEVASFLREYSHYRRDTARLQPLLATHLSQVFIPLAFQHMVNNSNDKQLHGWINNLERVRDMLDTKLNGLVHDLQLISEQIANYKIEGDKDSPGRYKIRRPLLGEALLDYQEGLLSFREDFGALCEQQQPNASQMFGLADALYYFYRDSFVEMDTVNLVHFISKGDDEQWQVEDQSNASLSVDTGCLQLLADSLDRPSCPLEGLPLEASRRRQQCRQQLWRDLVDGRPHIPVTSYLAYTQTTAVSVCLLAWMAANSHGVCQDVPFSIVQSVHDARCFFDSPGNQTCLQSNASDAICSVSRAILLLKCRDFSSVKTPELCRVYIKTTGQYSETESVTWKTEYFNLHGKATDRTLSYKESLNSATLKYKDFKVHGLESLEYSFIAVNMLFRLSTVSVYVWLPHLGNLPGKILLSFHVTGLVQIVCSELLYRAAGVPALSWAVLIDSALTLLSCLWLNTFCYQMYACVRHLRLPNHLTPAEASAVFRRQLLWALTPWGAVCTACIALEQSSKYHLIHSRIIFVVAISTSVAFNVVSLGLVAYIYHRNKKSMEQLKILSSDKDVSRKELVFLSVNTVILSGICVIIRIGFHQAAGLAQYVYYVHIATMLQGPVLFVFFVCNPTTLPVLRNRILAWWKPGIVIPGQELGSAADRNFARRRRGSSQQSPAAETSL